MPELRFSLWLCKYRIVKNYRYDYRYTSPYTQQSYWRNKIFFRYSTVDKIEIQGFCATLSSFKLKFRKKPNRISSLSTISRILTNETDTDHLNKHQFRNISVAV